MEKEVKKANYKQEYQNKDQEEEAPQSDEP
jgi:hypothetical protein